jgi:hypothetical protein
LPERFIFIGLQIIGDAVQSLAFTTPFGMMDEVIEVAKRHDLSVVVKRHPACKSVEIQEYLRRRGPEIVVATGNIHDIIPASTAVCVVNSGVGSEALPYEKPVYLFGRADYMGACFVCENPGDFARQFSPGKANLPPNELRKFWYYYRNTYACNVLELDHARGWIGRRVRQHLALSSFRSK